MYKYLFVVLYALTFSSICHATEAFMNIPAGTKTTMTNFTGFDYEPGIRYTFATKIPQCKLFSEIEGNFPHKSINSDGITKADLNLITDIPDGTKESDSFVEVRSNYQGRVCVERNKFDPHLCELERNIYTWYQFVGLRLYDQNRMEYHVQCRFEPQHTPPANLTEAEVKSILNSLLN